MLRQIKMSTSKLISKYINSKQPVNTITINWIKKDENSWLYQQLGDNCLFPSETIYSIEIEKIAQETNQLGPQPLWSGYEGNNTFGGSTRMPNTVRTAAIMGNLYTDLVEKLQPNIIVEFGTAFGVSGMYFLAGLESNCKGELLTFEPNDVWRDIAKQNLSKISNRFNSISGTFEENIDSVLPYKQSIDIAFIDAIHTKEFVIPQLEIVFAKSSDKAIIILDDIEFSDSMRECWAEVSKDSRFLSSVELNRRVGILELSK
jgi:predicted O-methyltransferase YrrM